MPQKATTLLFTMGYFCEGIRLQYFRNRLNYLP